MITRIIWATVIAAICVYIARSWTKWLRDASRPAMTPRTVILLVGMVSASVSLALVVSIFMHAQITGGFPFYHPTLLRMLRIGSLTALLGLFAAAIGKGASRIQTVVCSVFCLLVWLMEAISQ